MLEMLLNNRQMIMAAVVWVVLAISYYVANNWAAKRRDLMIEKLIELGDIEDRREVEGDGHTLLYVVTWLTVGVL